MSRHIACILAGLIVAAHDSAARAQVVAAPIGTPVDHPVVSANPDRTAVAWRKGVERFGEALVRGSFRLRGYEVIDHKLPGNHGIDLVAVKRNSAGITTDIRLIEVKTHYGQGTARLGQTKAGQQMSRKWLVERLRALRSTGEQGRALALEISRFHTGQRIPIERLGEVHEVNLRTFTYTIRNPLTMAERAGSMSIERLLNKVALRSHQPFSASWALRHLPHLDQVRQARMGHWLQGSVTTRTMVRVSATPFALLQGKQALRGAGRVFVRAAGPVGTFVAVVLDAHEIYGHVRNYQLGQLSQREFVIAVARSGGGIAGATAGAAGGAWAGAQLGALGGPCAWVTVPAGAVIGGVIGGIAGHLGGSYAAEAATQAWYESLDSIVKEEINHWVKATGNPFAN